MPKIKNILIFLVIAVVLVLVYVFVFKKSPEQPSLFSSSGSALSTATTNIQEKTSSISKDFLAVLLSVKSIKIDDSIFSDPAFISLYDSSIELISDGNEGRPNPFAPLGFDVSMPVSAFSGENNLTTVDTTITTNPLFPTIPDIGAPGAMNPDTTGTTGN